MQDWEGQGAGGGGDGWRKSRGCWPFPTRISLDIFSVKVPSHPLSRATAGKVDVLQGILRVSESHPSARPRRRYTAA